jgi:hypothetical protein
MRIYNPDDWSYETMHEPTSFTYTLDEPTYEFGDEYEFDESPQDDEIFTGTNNFFLGDYIDGAEGVGFQVVQGAFKVIPNFDTTMW